MNQDEFNVTYTNYSIYDTGLCIWTGGDLKTDVIPLYPQEIKSFEWNFNAPSADEIAQLRVTCPIRFKFDFLYQSKSQIDVLVANSKYLTELQQAGKATAFSPTLNVGRGPIKIYFDFGTTLPARENSNLTVYIRAEDKGSGMLKAINPGNFIINFQGFSVPPGNSTCPYFNCSGASCTNNEPIAIINRKTLDIRCSNIKTPGVDTEKTYFISAILNYGYYVTGEADIEVKP
jgi:hypothetical protein